MQLKYAGKMNEQIKILKFGADNPEKSLWGVQVLKI